MLDPMKPIIMHKNDALKDIPNEEKQIINSTIQLEQLPDKFSGLTVKSKDGTITYIEEFDEYADLSNNRFRCNYAEARLYFNSSQEGKSIKIAYKGTGYTLISTERIYHSINPITHELDTMKDILDDSLDSLDTIREATDNANKATTNANNASKNANDKITEMNNLETNLTALKTTLEKTNINVNNAEAQRVTEFNTIKNENATLKTTLEKTNTDVNIYENKRVADENTRKENEEQRKLEHSKRIIKAQYSIDGSTWTDESFTDSQFIKISLDNGETWKDPVKVKGEKGDKGDQGDQGQGLNIKGSLSNESELPPTGLEGDCYLINGDLYVWDDTNKVWINNGNIKGEKGDKGDIGLKGNTGVTPNIQIGTVATLDPNELVAITKRGTIEDPIFDFGIPKGRDGNGDMNKATYDKNNNGIVDNAEKVNGHTVESDVPSDLNERIKLATVQEATTGLNTTRLMTPNTTREAILQFGGGSGGVANVFVSGFQSNKFIVTEVTDTFTIPNCNANCLVELVYKNIVLNEGSNYVINKTTGIVTLNFELAIEDEVYYTRLDTSYSYNKLIDIPDIFPPQEHNHNSLYYSKEEIDSSVGDMTTVPTTSKQVAGAITELFQNANNGKQNWVDVIGSPLLNIDTFATLNSKTQTIKNDMASKLSAKGQTASGIESLQSMVNKIANINTGITPNGTAVAGDVLYGKTFYGNGTTKLTGTAKLGKYAIGDFIGFNSLITAPQQVWSYGDNTDGVWSVVVDKNNNIYSGLGDGVIKKISSNGSQVWSFTGHTDYVSLAVDNNGYIYSGGFDRTVRKINSSGSQIWSFTGHSYIVSDVAVDNNGYVYSSSFDKTVRKINSNGSQIWNFTGHTDWAKSVAVDNNGYVYSGSNDKTVRKITSSGSQVWSFTDIQYGVHKVAVDNNGNTYICSDTVIKIDFNGQLVWKFTEVWVSLVHEVVIDNNGYIYIGDSHKEVKKITSEGKLLWRFGDHAGEVKSVALDNDNNVYSGSDNTVKKIKQTYKIIS